MPKENKRKHKRYVVNDIQGNILYPSDLNIINISIDGAAIETKKRLELNKEYSFKIKLEDSFLHLNGRVVWSILSQKEKKDSGEFFPVYKAGVRFTNILTEKANILMKFIEDKRLKTYERRFGGIRVKITSSDDVKIDLPYKCKVKEISFLGMLVETECPLNLNVNYEVELIINENLIIVIGKVSNCVKIDSEGVDKYDIGIEIMKMSDKDKELLKSFIDDKEFY
ncbi:MAG: PilZ domain-containing protein [Nitrospirota bacterium]|nr:PilZ domain-containing protein [Nitrospirota bacterium]